MKRYYIFRVAFASFGWLALESILLVSAHAQENVRYGPLRLTLGLTAGMGYDDNANSSEKNPKSDYKLTLGPTINGGIFLPFAGGEQFTLSMSATYTKSLTGVTGDTFGAPLSATLTLPLYVSQWAVVVSDSFGFTNDPLETTFAANRTKVTQYSNTASGSATRQLGRLALTLATTRTDKFSPAFPQTEETQYQFSVTPAFFFRENYSVFFANSVGIILPQDPARQESIGWSSSIGLSGQITPYLSGSISLGFAHSHLKEVLLGPGSGIFGGIFDPDKVNADNVDGISSALGLSYSHPLRPNTTYAFSFFHSPGVTALLNNSQIQETSGVNFGLAHRFSPSLTLAPAITWSYIQDVGNKGAGERANLVGLSLGISRAITRNLNGSLTYTFQTRISNLTGQSYDANRVSITLNYTF
jgi:hypothetical protein